MDLQRAADALRACDAVVVAAGAGMSVPAGNDYWDKTAFAQRFPGMLR